MPAIRDDPAWAAQVPERLLAAARANPELLARGSVLGLVWPERAAGDRVPRPLIAQAGERLAIRRPRYPQPASSRRGRAAGAAAGVLVLSLIAGLAWVLLAPETATPGDPAPPDSTQAFADPPATTPDPSPALPPEEETAFAAMAEPAPEESAIATPPAPAPDAPDAQAAAPAPHPAAQVADRPEPIRRSSIPSRHRIWYRHHHIAPYFTPGGVR